MIIDFEFSNAKLTYIPHTASDHCLELETETVGGDGGHLIDEFSHLALATMNCEMG